MAQLQNTAFAYTGVFDLTSTPKSLVIQDNTDWASLIIQGYAPLGIFLKSVFTSSSGSQVLYDNLSNQMSDTNYDITYPSTQSGNQIVLPLQSNNPNIAFGLYTIYLEYRYLDSDLVEWSNTVSASYEFTFTAPAVTIAHRINLASSTITTIDTTNYGGGVISSSREHTISPPTNAQLPPLNLPVQTTTLATNVYVNITTGTWGAKVITTITYQLESGWQTTQELIGCIEFVVFSTVDLNKLLCCLDEYKSRYEEQLLKNFVAAENIKKQYIEPVLLNIGFYYMYLQAGCVEKANKAIQAIIDITKCGNCACGGDECPTPIPSISAATPIYVVDSPNNTITVTSDIIGDATIFHVEVSQNILTQLANIKQYIVSGQDPITVSTIISPDGLSVTYQVALNRPMPLMQNLAVIRTKIYYDITWKIETLEIFTDTQGFVVNPYASQNIQFAAGTTASDPVAILFTDFFTGKYPFICTAQIMNWYSLQDETTILPLLKNQNVAEANVMWVENDIAEKGNQAIIRLYNPINGEILSFDDLNQEASYYLSITVQAP